MLTLLCSLLRPGSTGTSTSSGASKRVDANRARAQTMADLHMNKPSGRTQREGNTLATPEDVAKKTARGTALSFKASATRNSLIDWSPSRQAHILDWHHRAKDYGLAVD